MKKVLILEDEKDIVCVWIRQFDLLLKSEKPHFLFAASITEAVEQFKLHQEDLGLIVFDGCIAGGGGEPNTKILVEVFRRSFKGPMIASSSQPHFRKILLDAGCDHECLKEDVPKKVIEVLGLV